MIIVSAGPGRSGTTWYTNMVRDLLTEVGVPDNKTIREHYQLQSILSELHLDLNVLKAKNLLRLLPVHLTGNKIMIKTHNTPTRSSRLFAHLGILRTIYIYRDPRDRMVSALKLSQKHKDMGRTDSEFSKINGFDDALNRFLKRTTGHKDVWEKHPHTLAWRYEDVIFKPIDMLLRTRDFLSLPLSDSTVEKIIESYRLKGDPADQIGRYKDYFTREQKDQINQAIGDEIVHLGYTLD